MRTGVTDREGRYLFIVDPGEYYLTVTHPQIAFPSEILRGKPEDVSYTHLYTGGTIRVTEENTTINPNIPLDPDVKKKTNSQILIKHYLRKLQNGFSLVGPIGSLISMLINPTPLFIILFFVHLILYTLFSRLARPPQPKSWGLVFEQKTGKTIPRTVIRLFDQTYHKLLETQVSNNKGRYAFLVGPNTYQLNAQKIGYQGKTLDNLLVAEQGFIDQDLRLMKGGEAPPNLTPQTPNPPTGV